MSGLSLFHWSTIDVVASIAAGWSDSDWNVSVTGSLLPDAPPVAVSDVPGVLEHAESRSAPAARLATSSVRRLIMDQVTSQGGWGGDQPLTAPESRPPVSFFCMIEKKTIDGMAASTDPAASGPSATLPSPPTNIRRAIGRV